MPNFIEIMEKNVTKILLHPSIFLLSMGPPWPNVTGLDGGVHPPPLANCKISSRSDDPSPIYLLPNFFDFVAGVTTKKNKKHTVNDMSPHYNAAPKTISGELSGLLFSSKLNSESRMTPRSCTSIECKIRAGKIAASWLRSRAVTLYLVPHKEKYAFCWLSQSRLEAIYEHRQNI